ncbi:aldehyde dehydrogenase family protein [Marinitenerispora sediminis]|uniref:Aldehyde dehydrogenase n=1 Tax=Marinitenerispora sediminis TaxID=1931232 RepID=A0A368T1X5_9ACTN|nr:aldehyde dehydrogenase family protein [Marinitenerispora sediminis]RCV47925.1 aldehyde dehydrogenase [Marinitenerispora sediminis]RCV48675.1 aldehyde dehydrogenase [Marinitenerispora sediminis]RCV49301.1 aldehyde dehydrogenase [Marinitenerispora sediminis]
MTLISKPGTDWTSVYRQCREAAPEAFGADRALNHWGGRWRADGEPRPAFSPVDGSQIAGPPMVGAEIAAAAVAAAAAEHRRWRRVPLAERRRRVAAALDAWEEHRDLLALALVWEIGKPWRLACQDVDRAISGVRWYLDEIDGMLRGRTPLDGPVSNIASWNYPMSVLAHAMCVQALAGNAAIAKTPTDGGLVCLTLAVALAVREGLPFTLVSGGGRDLSPVLVRGAEIGCVSFVGGRDAGGQVATALADLGRRHVLEQEGLNCWGVWEFSDWDTFAGQVRRTFDYGKQRCTAYPRFVVQRDLFDAFLAAYLPAVSSVRFGHPLAVSGPDEDLPELDFGPLINAAKAKELRDQVAHAVARGAIPLYRGSLDGGRFLPGQNTDAYLAPVTLLEPPRSSPLFHAEPFGPVDSIVLVDTEAELLAAMNASNGALVGSVSCDDEDTARRIAAGVRAFKVGVNAPRSRGDRAELFGGWGDSWRGAFVGGHLLVHAVTAGGPEERPPGNFPEYTLRPSPAAL